MPDPVDPVTTLYPDTVSGQYFRFTLKDSTVIYRQPGPDSLAFSLTNIGYVFMATSKGLRPYYGIWLNMGPVQADTTGAFPGHVEVSLNNGTPTYPSYSNSLVFFITKSRHDTLEGYMQGMLLQNNTQDSFAYKADFRMFHVH
ncbi:hypothetical protein GA0116948_12225 [Chitinophaga costaii]|uniref:Uncharacterized protein n=1 Tax=Chitinophaga costaii TaxID=1335309 RepID=A0A1C4G5S7_9BACT|nr:hypothetical protein [Chitinophaga costaii]SCC63121.1 hypothetical protein GA0116948_12225 [Chitinophaga costaii]